MIESSDLRIALLYPGDAEARRNSTLANNRFAPLVEALLSAEALPEPAVYHDDFCADV